MKINKITLTDYRSHKGENLFVFTDGINLLLGKNGAGKSSILEALGLAFFGSGNRTNIKDAINFDAKSALIVVDFEAVDGNDYILERKLGTSNSYRLYLKGEESARIEGELGVSSKIKILTGIDKNAADIYMHVITAYQNQLTGIFLETSQKRETVFNKIFNTEIYRNIYENYSRTAEGKYQNSKISKLGTLEGLNSKLLDSSVLENEISQAQTIQNSLAEKLKAITSEIGILAKMETDLKEIKNKIDSNVLHLANNIKLRDTYGNNLNDAKNRLESSEKALTLVTANEIEYSKYNQISVDLKSLQSEINLLEKSNEEKQENEKKLNENLNQQTRLISSIDNIKKNIEEKKLHLDKLNAEIAEQNGLIEKSESEQESAKTQINLLINQQADFDKLNNSLLDLISNEKSLSQKLADKHSSKVNILEISGNIEKAEMKIADLNLAKEEKQKISALISQLNARIKDNRDAKDVLTGGICPYLKEDCKNISSGSSADEFFKAKEVNLMAELSAENLKLSVYSELDKQLKESQNNHALLIKTKSDGEKLLHEIEILSKDIKIAQNEIELNRNYVIDFIKTNIPDLLVPDDSKDFKFAENYLTGRSGELKGVYREVNEKINSLNSTLKKITTEHSNIITEIEALTNSNELNAKKFNVLEISEIELRKSIKLLDGILSVLPEKKSKQNELSTLRESYQKAYNTYKENESKSKEIETHKTKIDEIADKLTVLNDEFIRIQILEKELKNQFSEDELLKIVQNLSDKRTEEKSVLSDFTTIKSDIESKKQILLKNRQSEKEIAELNKVIIQLDKKIDLTRILRGYLNEMGRLVANRLLEKIEYLATENYRRISGRTERILWKNDKEQSYMICLDIGQYIKKFEQLSGGEQVAVAIAVRSAMAEILTKANFAIFDEPTNNLDVERRAALSESLQDMFKNLRQAIIVTHDNSFREMAQNVIELG